MKLKYWTFIIALYAGSLCSCSDFLSEDPKGNITTNYSETEEGCERLVLSLYNTTAISSKDFTCSVRWEQMSS